MLFQAPNCFLLIFCHVIFPPRLFCLIKTIKLCIRVAKALNVCILKYGSTVGYCFICWACGEITNRRKENKLCMRTGYIFLFFCCCFVFFSFPSHTHWTKKAEMPTSRDLKSGDFCDVDGHPLPSSHNQCTTHFLLLAYSTPLPPKKTHPLSFNRCFLQNPRCRNSLRNCERRLKNWNCFNLETQCSHAKVLKHKKAQIGFYLGDLVTSYGRLPK